MIDIEVKHGIYVNKPFEQLFTEGKINSFIKPVITNVHNEYLYVCSGSYVFGIIHIDEIKRLKNKELEKTFSEHRINLGMKNMMYGMYGRIYQYCFTPSVILTPPIKYNYIGNMCHFIENVEVEHAITNTQAK